MATPPADEPCSIAPALAAAFAAGYSRIFRGTVIQRELLEIRDRTIARLSKANQGRFDDIDRKVVVLSSEEEVLDGHDGTLISIVEALLDQLEVKITYEHFGGTVEKLTIRPYSLVAVQSRLYVVAPRDGSPYPFRFQRIRRAQVTTTSFVYPTLRQYDPNRVFEDSMGIWLNEPAPTLITIRLAPTWASYAKYHQWHPSQKRRARADGGVEIDLFVRPCPEFQAWVLGFGSDAEVIAPGAVRDSIASRLAAAARLYTTQ